MDTHPHSLAALSVLVVDDDADTVASYVDLLTLYGCTARAARCGDEALALAEIDPPDVVLLDVAMPKMDGWELARRLRSRYWANPPLLIAISGYGQSEDLRHSSDVGIHLHLLKPADPDVLVRILRRCVPWLRPAVAARPSPEPHVISEIDTFPA